MDALLEQVQPLLAFARQATREGRMQEAIRAVEACRVYLDLHAEPRYETYNPAHLIREEAGRITDATRTLDVEPVSDCIGQPSRMFDCLRQLVGAARLDEGSVLAIEVFDEDGVPCAALGFDGPGGFPEEVLVEGFLPMTLDELGRRWTLATRGGRIEDAANGLLLSLAGLRMPPASVSGLEHLIELLAQLEVELGEPALDHCLAIVEGEQSANEAVGLKALLGEVLDDVGPALADRVIDVETLTAPDTPPILMQRTAMRRFFVTIARYAMAILPGTGTITILVEYDAASRTVGIVAGIQGARCVTHETFHLAALRRTIVEQHQGTLEFVPEDAGVTLTAALRDPVGAALDDWIPGFEAFTQRSKDMLRLLKSGGPAPPEDFILPGILEAELEAWLLPHFAGSVALNLAHKVPEENPALPGASPARLKKALAQIRRGKPRKEIAAPAYAAEVLWAFRRDARHRGAVGAAALDEAAIENLCLALLETPPDCVTSLGIVARAIVP